MIGRTLGHYRIEARLGEGGMGVVYKALDTKLNRPVALKVLPPDLVDNEERRLRFQREAQAAAALNHPNICTIHEVGEQDGVDYLVMEYLEGTTLRARIGHKPMPLKSLMPVAIQIGEALQAAHERGVLHRDLKPDNVFVTKQGPAKVLDFGLAKLLHPEAGGSGDGGGSSQAGGGTGAVPADVHSRLETISRELTVQGKVFGTVAYMSPEQARGERVDHRSDLFSFGVVLYEMATGRQPFKGKTDAETLASILKEEAPPASSVTGEARPELERIITKALEKDPGERYHHADDMVADLRRLKRTTDSDVKTVRTPGGPVAVVGRGVERRGLLARAGRWGWLSAAAVVVVLLAIIAGWQWVARRPAAGFPASSRIVIADFENATGQPQFDTAVKEAFEAMLGGSTSGFSSSTMIGGSDYLWVISGEELADLRRSGGGGTTMRLDAASAVRLCRERCDGFITGRIARDGSAYRIEVGLHRRGEEQPAFTESTTAASEDEIVGALWKTSHAVRRWAGESVQTIASMEPPATRSLAALQAVAAAGRTSSLEAAMGLRKRAIEIDPDFVDAYVDLGVNLIDAGDWEGSRNITAEAYRRSSHLGPIKRAWTEINYLMATLQIDTEIEHLKSQMAMYPLDPRYLDWLGWIYYILLEDPVGAEPLYRAWYRISPSRIPLFWCVNTLERQGKAQEIDELIDDALRMGKLPSRDVEPLRISAHVLRRDWVRARALIETFGSERYQTKSFMTWAYADGLLGAGRFREGREAVIATWRAVSENNLFSSRGSSVLARGWIDGRTSGKFVRLARGQIAPLDRSIYYLPLIAIMAVETGQEEPLTGIVRDQEAGFKGIDSRFLAEELEFARSCLLLVRGRPAEARPALERLAYNSILLRRHHVLGRAYEALGMWKEAAGEYEEVLRYPFRKGYLGLSAFWALDQFRAAQACERAGDTARARHWYEQFATDWKDADPDIPELIEARERLQALGGTAPQPAGSVTQPTGGPAR